MTSNFRSHSSVGARPPHRTSPLTRTAAVALLVAGTVVAGAGASTAHVRVTPDNTASGSYSALTFRVPNESATASTVKLAVQLPQEDPFVFVSLKPVAGWTAKTTEAPLPKPVELEGTSITKAVRTITWTADDKDAQIAPGEYQEFSISVGPLPTPGSVTLPAVQTYSDGVVSSWNQPPAASGDEPENPAPVLVVTAAAGEAGGAGSSAAESPAAGSPAGESPAVAPGTPVQSSVGSDGMARGLAGTALAVALAGLVTAVLAWRRRHAG